MDHRFWLSRSGNWRQGRHIQICIIQISSTSLVLAPAAGMAQHKKALLASRLDI
jgi:hypothetical protein